MVDGKKVVIGIFGKIITTKLPIDFQIVMRLLVIAWVILVDNLNKTKVRAVPEYYGIFSVSQLYKILIYNIIFVEKIGDFIFF